MPLGTGAYRVGRFEAGRYIEYDRVKDWWGADLPVSRGQDNFDVAALRVLSRPRRRVRRLHRQELPVPRGVHLAHLGDALRVSGDQRRPRQARGAARRDAVGRAGLVPQHPARQVQGSSAARSADLCLRLRVDQQEHHVRVVRPHPFGVPEFRHDGGGKARSRRARPARAVSRQGAGRGVRRAVRAAGVGRLGAGSRAAAQGGAAAAGGRLHHQGRQARRTRKASGSRSSS